MIPVTSAGIPSDFPAVYEDIAEGAVAYVDHAPAPINMTNRIMHDFAYLSLRSCFFKNASDISKTDSITVTGSRIMGSPAITHASPKANAAAAHTKGLFIIFTFPFFGYTRLGFYRLLYVFFCMISSTGLRFRNSQ